MESLTNYIIGLSYLGIFATVFAESGLFFGFFLPGDSLLFTAGLFAARGDLNLTVLCLGCFIAAVAGDQVGYWFGAKIGRGLYQRQESFFFRREYVEKTKEFYERHGKKTIVLARFVPIVRTFAPIVAGVAEMPYGTFIRYNLLGGLLWGVGLPIAGYYLGTLIPDIDQYLLPIIIAVIVLSILPPVLHFWHRRKAN